MSIFDKFSGINIASGFKLQAAAPLDPRQVVDSIEKRDALITEKGAFEGMQVYVKADKKTYLLKDLETGTWEEVGQGGGGGSSVQADYDQNDSTAADYIKNRPFYEETKTGETEVFNETLTFKKQEDSEKYVGGNESENSQPLDGINPDDTISVTFNGTEYSCVVEKIQEEEIIGIQFGNVSLLPDNSGKDTGEPFIGIYANIGNGSNLQFLTTIQSTSIPVIIKTEKATTVIHTIDAKFIKDMYYETTSETEVYTGTLTTTKSGSSYTASLPLAYGWFPTDVATAKITIDGVTQFLPVAQDNDNQLCLIGGLSVDDYGVTILTSGESTSILTKEQYSNVLLTISSYEDYIKKVPSKYLSIGFEIDVSVESITNDNIAEALKTYLTNNAEDLTTLTTSETFQLNVSSGSTVSYIYRQGYITANSSELRFFCNYINPEDLFDAYTYTEGYVLIIKTSGGVVSTVTIKHTSILSSLPAWVFKVADIEEDGDLNFGLLGILHLNKDTSMYEDFNGLVALHDWITKAQKRDDFQIPAPTKETDLIDKKYVDSKVTGAVKYLGAVKTLDALTALTSNKGDFCRVETAFNLAAANSASGSEVSLHASDMLICESIKTDSAAAKWSVIHGEIDSNTWVANTKTAAGYVAAGGDNANKVWKTDSSGAPGWRDDANTTYSDATTSTHGLMSTADKQKLDGLNDSNYVKTSGSQSINGTKTFNDTQNFKGYLNIYGTAAEKHLKTRGIAGSDGNGAEGDLYLQYSSDNKTLFGKTGNSSLNSDGSVTIEGKTAATTDQLPAAVSANPTLSGSETELTGLKIGSTNYKIPSSSGSSGSTVTPLTITQVTGSENQIGGLMIDDKKYCFYQLTNKVGNYIAKLTPENTMWTLDNAYGSFQTPGYLIAGYGSSTSFENAVALGPSGLYIMNNWNKYKITLPDKESTLATIDYVTGNATVPDGSVTLDLNTLKIGGVYFKIPTVDTSEFVTLSGDQTITGKNTFTLQQTFNTSPICQSCITVAAAINTTAAPIAYYNFSSISYKSADSTIYTYSFPSKTGVLALTSDIVANPTLAGTEKSLTGITIKGTSYKIASGSGSGGVTAAGNNTFTGNNTFSSGSITLLTNGGTGGKAIYSSSTIQYTPAKSSTKYVISLPEKEGTLAIEENTIQKLYRHQITISGTDDTYGKCQVTLVTDSTVSTAWDPATEFSAEEPQVRLTYNPCTIVYNDNANITNGVFVYNDSNTIVIMAPVIESGESTNATFSLTSITVSDNTYLI